MASTAKPTRPAHYNARLSASGFGEIYVKITSIAHGMNVISSSSETRFSKTVYTEAVTGGSFTLGLVCPYYTEWARLGAWLRAYGRKVATPGSGIGPVRVQCPARNFDKVAIPTSADFGDAVVPYTYTSSVRFIGSRDPVPLSSKYVSYFSLPKSDDKSLPYYYPAGKQLSGTGTGDDALYDYPPKSETDSTPNILDLIGNNTASGSPTGPVAPDYYGD